MDDPYVAPVLQEPGIIPLTLLYLMSHSNHSNNHSGTFSSLVENAWDVQYKQYKYINIRLPVQPESTRRTCLWSSFEILQQNQNYRQSFHLVSIKGNLQITRYNVGDDWVNLLQCVVTTQGATHAAWGRIHGMVKVHIFILLFPEIFELCSEKVSH